MPKVIGKQQNEDLNSGLNPGSKGCAQTVQLAAPPEPFFLSTQTVLFYSYDLIILISTEAKRQYFQPSFHL